MATRSRIGVELPNGKVKSVYCHWDGYPSGVGQDLKDKNFQSTEEVIDFINEGDRSTVDLSYKEYRGENRPPIEHKSREAYFKSDIEEWGYLYTLDNEWIYKKG